LPAERPEAKHTYHLFVIRAKKRKQLQEWLKQNDIETSIHYPTPLPFLKPYEYMNHKPEDFPVSWVSKDEIVSLPLFPEITEEQIKWVAGKIDEFYAKGHAE